MQEDTLEALGVQHPPLFVALQKEVEGLQVGTRILSTGPSFAQLIPPEPELARKPRQSLASGADPAGYLCRWDVRHLPLHHPEVPQGFSHISLVRFDFLYGHFVHVKMDWMTALLVDSVASHVCTATAAQHQ